MARTKLSDEEMKQRKREYNNKYRAANPEKARARCAKWQQLARYGITIEEKVKRISAQCGVCAICKQPESVVDGYTRKTRQLSTDHCHRTGKVRGFICASCNISIGGRGDSSSVAFERMLYLWQHEECSGGE